jgi:hypothetical protein
LSPGWVLRTLTLVIGDSGRGNTLSDGTR